MGSRNVRIDYTFTSYIDGYTDIPMAPICVFKFIKPTKIRGDVWRYSYVSLTAHIFPETTNHSTLFFTHKRVTSLISRGYTFIHHMAHFKSKT